MAWITRILTRGRDNLRNYLHGVPRRTADNRADDHERQGWQDYSVELTAPVELEAPVDVPGVAHHDFTTRVAAARISPLAVWVLRRGKATVALPVGWVVRVVGTHAEGVVNHVTRVEGQKAATVTGWNLRRAQTL